MPDLEEIIDGLREKHAVPTFDEYANAEGELHVPLDDAVAAVHAAADARTQETVEMLREIADSVDYEFPDSNPGGNSPDYYSGQFDAAAHLADEVARRFPNGGTPSTTG